VHSVLVCDAVQLLYTTVLISDVNGLNFVLFRLLQHFIHVFLMRRKLCRFGSMAVEQGFKKHSLSLIIVFFSFLIFVIYFVI